MPGLTQQEFKERWRLGTWLGKAERSDENLIADDDGVHIARSIGNGAQTRSLPWKQVVPRVAGGHSMRADQGSSETHSWQRHRRRRMRGKPARVNDEGDSVGKPTSEWDVGKFELTSSSERLIRRPVRQQTKCFCRQRRAKLHRGLFLQKTFSCNPSHLNRLEWGCTSDFIAASSQQGLDSLNQTMENIFGAQ